VNRRTLVRILIGVGVVILAGAGVGAWLLYGRDFVVRIPEARIQEALDRRFPIDKRHLLIFTVRYRNPKVRLEEGTDRIQAGVDAETLFRVNEQPFTGSASASGVLAYDPATGEFHLKDARVERLSIGGVPEKYTALVDGIATELLKDRLDRTPVHRLRATDVKQALARLVLKRVVVRDGHLDVTMGLGPSERPR
jgi:hypothetical protein